MERCDNQRTIFRWSDWTPSTLQLTHRGIAVDCHHEQISLTPRTSKESDVPSMNEIKTAIGENNACTRTPLLAKDAHEGLAGEDLFSDGCQRIRQT